MANHASALKRIRQNKKRNLRNKALRSEMRTELKRFWKLIEKKDVTKGQEQISFIHKKIDKMRTKGVINKNFASRKKSQVQRWLNDIKSLVEKTAKKHLAS